jgi:uncharacterized membrane protein YsdA (DUF1294 family)
MNILIYIALSANGIAFVQMAIDKRLAVKQKNRIPEAQLIAPTLFGGFPGVLLGMILFRHKTAKKSFQLKLALALILFCAMAYSLFTRV